MQSTIRFVSFRDELFALEPEDFKVLRDRGVTISRIPKDVFPILQKTLLSSVNVQYFSWPEVYEKLLEQFKSSFPKKFSFHADENWLVVRVEDPDEEDKKVYDVRYDLLSQYAARYSFRVRQQVKNKEDHVLIRLVFVFDPSIIPSFYFGTNENSTTPLKYCLQLSPNCRIRFERQKSPTGMMGFKAVFEDKVGDDWSENTSRAFNFSYLSAETCREAVNFFGHLVSIIDTHK